MKTTEPPIQRADRILGRLVLRTVAVVAFLGAVGSAVFSVTVLADGHIFPGILALALAGLFLWLGRRAWRDRTGLGDLLNRDYESPKKDRPS